MAICISFTGTFSVSCKVVESIGTTSDIKTRSVETCAGSWVDCAKDHNYQPRSRDWETVRWWACDFQSSQPTFHVNQWHGFHYRNHKRVSVIFPSEYRTMSCHLSGVSWKEVRSTYHRGWTRGVCRSHCLPNAWRRERPLGLETKTGQIWYF